MSALLSAGYCQPKACIVSGSGTADRCVNPACSPSCRETQRRSVLLTYGMPLRNFRFNSNVKSWPSSQLLLPRREVRVRKQFAMPDTNDSDPLLSMECPVPEDQQPMVELKNLQEALLFNWATLPASDFVLRLVAIWGVFLVTLGLPVSAVTFDMRSQGLECFVAASIGSLFIVIVTVLRLYLGWAHVGNRLLSATVEYEETGWYDGQIWVKTPQVLMRDRLLGTYTVRPALQRLKATLISLAGITAMSVALLALSPTAPAQSGTPPTSLPTTSAPLRPATQSRMDYWESVECFEPWGVDDPRGEEGGSLSSSYEPTTRKHSSSCSAAGE